MQFPGVNFDENPLSINESDRSDSYDHNTNSEYSASPPQTVEGGGFSVSHAVFHPLESSYGVLRWASSTVEDRMLLPISNRISKSVLNPNVLSAHLWERLKQMTPQRARDVTRIVATAIANSVGVLKAEQALVFRDATSDLQQNFVKSAASVEGQEVVLNSVASISKVAEALNTPEVRRATEQLGKTFQSWVTLMASTEGKKLTKSVCKTMDNIANVAASPESQILLAEFATNVCHALEVESHKNSADNGNNESSGPTSDFKISPEDNARRCASIEKSVLEHMGVDQSIVGNWEAHVEAMKCDEGIEPNEKPEEDPVLSGDSDSDIIRPDWNQKPMRSALRRRHEKECEIKSQRCRKRSTTRTRYASRRSRQLTGKPLTVAKETEISIQKLLSQLIAFFWLLILFIWLLYFWYMLYPRLVQFLSSTHEALEKWRNISTT